ncbi:MAG: AAA family ATPase [Planctomycetaceae bacterium]|nr:AAA family ATPase [Planctomycetales bacterium]MCB9873615.1 AAA family ATPase [Planctomycetaceae bacterium]MCB9940165.1 AAA family ATPase [Planctomycetaceae bacterium]
MQTAAPSTASVNATVAVLPRRPSRAETHGFFPSEPQSLEAAGLHFAEIEGLILKFLLNRGNASGRHIASQIKLPFGLISPVLDDLKSHMLVTYRDSAPMNDYLYELTEGGLMRARQRNERCTFFGAAPVNLKDYVDSVWKQSIEKSKPRLADLKRAFAELQLPPAVVSQIGQAVNAGRALFLYGQPGNGKTSIAERVIRAVSEYVWIPRTITVTDEIIRLYDPSTHEAVQFASEDDDFDVANRVDHRWVLIKRPTVVAGGELTLQMLECNRNPATGINEAPLQMKSNGGALVIDDFGRQRISTTELLNRWIVPLEKGHDYLSLPSGRQIEVPFAQLLVFSTNLDPTQIVDEAFLRRIPYKVEVFDPSEADFRALFCRSATQMGFSFEPQIVDYLLDKHYRSNGRGLRFCHSRDILLQVKNLCEFHEQPFVLTETNIDVAIYNYFAGL